MPRADLRAGLTLSRSIPVDASLIVPSVSPRFSSFADMPPVFATAFMVGFVEATCIEALRPYLLEGEHTVGTHIDISHVAATPIGLSVRAEIELTAVEGRKLSFRVRCLDDRELIGEGRHERAIICTSSFLAKVEAKRVGTEKTARSAAQPFWPFGASSRFP
jgi:fluoroacetyl-CoA thioesterase